jgi:archaellum component FlaC
VIELSALAPWAAVVIAAASLLYSVFNGRSKDQKEKFDSLEVRVGAIGTKVDTVEDRVLTVENDLRHLPDKDATHKLSLGLQEVKTELAQLTERMKPISAMAGRIQEAMLEKVMQE